MSEAEVIIKKLNLKSHPEGGYYKEIYRSDEKISKSALPERYSGDRCMGTGIYYMLTPGEISAMHKVKSDETFHFYGGDATELLLLFPDGTAKIVELGNDIENGMSLTVTIEHGVWQGQRLKPGGKYALFGTTVNPGFEFDDFEFGKRDELIKMYPDFSEMILKLTK
jgi:uncharacterized protein